jgi:hypothetical protein
MKFRRFKLFKIVVKIFEIVKSWDTWQHIICVHYAPKNCILITSDNIYMANERMKCIC